MKNVPIPVFMYHSVGVCHNEWLWKYLTIEYKIFDRQMAFLKKMHCNTITLDELYEYMDKGTPVPKNSFVLTFDDGYADSWIAVAPILKKYGFRGTVYVNPEFVDPSDKCRPTLEDVWANKLTIEEIPWKGFLSWAEMKNLEKGGVLEIQSHAMSHTWYFCGPKIIDFQHPGDQYIWMNWNKYPERKYAYMSEDPERYKDYGAPVYEHGKSLAIRRYFPNIDLHNILTEYVNKNGGRSFFENYNWREKLKTLSNNLIEQLPDGYYESDDECQKRIIYELKTSKDILEKKLKKKIEYLCWPGGGYNDETFKKALEIYKSVTLGSEDRKIINNSFGDSPNTIKRKGVPIVQLGDNYQKMKYQGGYSLYFLMRTLQGNKFGNICRKIVKAGDLLQLKMSN